jgi:protein-disulfide isomerase
MENNGQKQIAGAIIIVGVLIAGAILLKGGSGNSNTSPLASTKLSPVGTEDRTLGNPEAKITLILYEDFQCPFCGLFFSDAEKNIKETYLKDGNVRLVYRDFAFLGPESVRSAEAARCAGDQGKFWDYHEYLYTHQNGENEGAFSDTNLKSFAKGLGLETASFNKCLDESKYTKAVADSKDEASVSGVSGTPKGFLVTSKNISSADREAITKAATTPGRLPAVTFYAEKNIVSLDGALPWDMVKTIIDILLK